MIKKNNIYLYALVAVIVIASIAMFSVNRYWYRFPGLFYFEPSFLGLSMLLYMIRSGLKLQFGLSDDAELLKFMKELSVYAFIIVVVIFATSAIQYTPFNPIDKKILMVEHYLHLDLKAAIAWLASKSDISVGATFIYNSVCYQVLFFPILVMLWRRYNVFYEFYFLVLVSWIIGSMIYYFFPTTGPASVIDSPYFIEAQRATGLKFWQLHHYIQPVTEDGGMIAMPSFHVIWAWLCVYLMRPWPFVFWPIFLINSIVAVCCVLLGWHYFLDVVGSVLTMLLSHAIYYFCHCKTTFFSLREEGGMRIDIRDFHPL